MRVQSHSVNSGARRAGLRATAKRSMRAAKRFSYTGAVFITWALILWPSFALAQDEPPVLPGVQSANYDVQYTQNNADATLRSRLRVDPSTLALTFHLPLGSYPGRGGSSLPISLSYSSKLWGVLFTDRHVNSPDLAATLPPNGTTSYGILDPAYGQHSVSGWTTSLTPPIIEWTGFSEIYEDNGNPGPCPAPSSTEGCHYIKRIRLYLSDGSSYELRADDSMHNARQVFDYTGTFVSVNGPRIRFQASNNTLFLPDGSRYIFPAQAFNYQMANQFIDRNGNLMTYNSATRRWTDVLGRSLESPLPVDPARGGLHYAYNPDSPQPVEREYSYPGVNGTTLVYKVRWKRLAQALTNTNEALPYRADHRLTGSQSLLPEPHLFTSPAKNRLCAEDTLFNPVVLHEVVLPNGKSYKFTYNSFGEITKAVYPTGGYERFRHRQIRPMSYQTDLYAQTNRGVTDSWVSPTGLVDDELHFVYNASGDASTYTTTVTAPDGTQTERLIHPSLTGANLNFGFDAPLAGMAYEERTFSSTGQMLRRTLTKHEVDGPLAGGVTTATRNPRVKKQVEILLDTGGTGNALAKTTTFDYDQDQNVTVTTYHEFVSVDPAVAQTADISQISPGAVLRREETTYLVNDGAIDGAVKNAYRNRQLLSLPTLKVIKDGAGVTFAKTEMRYDEAAYPLLSYSGLDGWVDPQTTVRGNATTTRHWLKYQTNPESYIETHAQYDQVGNLRNSVDAKGNQFETEYSSAYKFAYPTLTRTPAPDPSGVTGSSAALTTSNVFDFGTGLLTSTTDPNQKTTWVQYEPFLNRPSLITRPNGGGATTISYGDTAGDIYVRTQTDLDGSRDVESYRYFDGIGRETRAYQSEGALWAVSDTEYDSSGRVWRVSNPYRAAALNDGVINPPGKWTTTQYDDLGRVRLITAADGSTVTTDYRLNQVTVTDQAGKKRSSSTDSLGRLTTVAEDPLGLNYQTVYEYDPLGNLLKATQGTQPSRQFTYDSLSRLRTASNPEHSALTSYTYDANSNLEIKTDPRGVRTTFTYDRLNRATRRSYSNLPATVSATPAVDYKYDTATNGKGMLASVRYGAGTDGCYYDAYDDMGRLTASRQVTDERTYGSAYQYDLAGNLTRQTYPSGKMVDTEYDEAGRIAGVRQGANYYAGASPSDANNRIKYYAHGAVEALKLGNGLWENTQYNDRLQATKIELGTAQSTSSVLRLEFTYSTTGLNDNNGNVRSQKITAGAGAAVITQSYGYDSLSRLTSVQESVSASTRWTQTYGYDRFGNRTSLVNSGGEAGQLPTQSTPPVNAATNRLTGYAYDAAGNVTADAAANTFTYDAENRQSRHQGGGSDTSYAYDGDGRRVKKVDASGTTVFVYDSMGKLVAEYTTAALQGAGISYITQDHLGSTRVVTNNVGGVKARHDFMPYGEEIGAGTGGRTASQGYVSDNVRQKFTGKERDAESGLDYFLARYYSPGQGRFTSPDEFTGGPDELYYFASRAADNPTFYADIFDPQTLNKYQYCLNNPLRYVDPDGHQNPTASNLRDATAAATAARAGVELVRKGNPVMKAVGVGVLAVAGILYLAEKTDPDTVMSDPSCPSCSNFNDAYRKQKEAELNAQQNSSSNQSPNPGQPGNQGDGEKKPVFGEKGTQTTSTTVYKGVGKERIDVENPNPGQRPGQIHYQDNKGNKYLYDPDKKQFAGASKSVNKKLLSNPKIQEGIKKGLKVLGES